jgi:hypothetical protein
MQTATASSIGRFVKAGRERRRLIFPTVIMMALMMVVSALSVNHYSLSIDQAYMVESIDTTASTGVPRTQLTKTAIQARRTVINVPSEDVCRLPMPADTGPMMNIFHWHSFPIFYVIAPLRALFHGNTIVAWLGALNFVGMLVVVYLAARRYNVPVIPALGFVFLVSAHPAWSYSVFGQYYPDRMFMVFGLLYVIAAVSHFEDGPVAPWKLLVPAILATICTDRAGIMIGGFTLVAIIFYRGVKFYRADRLLVATAVIATSYALGYMKFVQANEDYASFLGDPFGQIAAFLRGEPIIVKFLLIHLMTFAVLASFHWRLGLIAAGAMLPNLLGNIGGAEKSAWMVHYHTLYFTFLVAAGLYGLIQIHRLFPRHTAMVSALLFAAGTVQVLSDPHQMKPLVKLSTANIGNYAPVRVARIVAGSPAEGGMRAHVAMVKTAAALVPNGSTVSSTEAMAPALYDQANGKKFYFFPLGIDTVDYVVLPYNTEEGRLTMSGAVSFRGAEEARKIDQCMVKRLEGSGFKQVAAVPLSSGGPTGMVVLRRN